MKGIKLLLAVCLALPIFGTARADDSADTTRAAVRRSTIGSQPNVREKSTPTTTRGTTTTSVKNNVTTSRGTTSRATATPDTARNTTNRTPLGVSARVTTTPNVITRSGTENRQTTVARTITRNAAPTQRSTTSRTAPVRSATRTRSASTGLTRADVMARDYSKCKTVYYDCMDEFCANKDSQLKRCACSTRVNEFDDIKKQLAQFDEQMLEFSQRLLTVNMDKEDAAALFEATEGEIAFNQADTSASKKMLDEIAKKLNTSFDDSNFNQSLNAISLSLNADAAFDSVDSLAGSTTVTKTGAALYNAAVPVCQAMAAEVCTPEEYAIAVSGYQMTIEQDCNTVFKTYQTQVDQARERIRENSALLDMSRLDIYQKRNSDDILTCKSKMLDMLTNSTVCGENLGKCLDTTGQYIDPTTGQAFLTTRLVNLSNLIQRPTENSTWVSMPANATFVSYLNSKKKFLAPAMENCQDIADYVWDEFIEDALAQIKLAQDAKLQEVRQSCTTLTAECLSDAKTSIEDFDARALSTFGVWADKTVNAMCNEVKTACTALLDAELGTGSESEWAGGMADIATNITYDTILSTCREVGRACIIQVCKSTSGNFGLCENIQTSVNRKSIINRTACWQEVQDCIADAGAEKISEIYSRVVNFARDDMTDLSAADWFYQEMYSADPTTINTACNPNNTSTMALADQPFCIYDHCVAAGVCNAPTISTDNTYTTNNPDASDECRICRLAEKIWGNCEYAPSTVLINENSHNRIIIPENNTTGTLLAWFAQNTGTDDKWDSCRDTTCGTGYFFNGTSCVSIENISSGDLQTCPTDERFQTPKGQNNCCTTNTWDSMGNCCTQFGTSTINLNGTDVTFCLPNRGATATLIETFSVANSTDAYYKTFGTTYALVCIGTMTVADQQPRCSGSFIVVSETGRVLSPKYDEISNGTPSALPNAYFTSTVGETVLNSSLSTYTLQYDTTGNTWQWTSTNASDNPIAATQGDKSMINYQ